jgi:hypothetical protein
VKIRNGFVSNSSSTSFVFVFKGKEFDDFAQLMSKYRKYFNISYSDPWWVEETDGREHTPSSFNYGDIVNAIECTIKRFVGKEDAWDKVEILPIDKLIQDLKDSIVYHSEYIKKEEEERRKQKDKYYRSPSYMEYLKEALEEDHKRLNTCSKLKGKGYSYIKISFGDNHGQISGIGLGATMDYGRDQVKVNEKDLIVYVDCEH